MVKGNATKKQMTSLSPTANELRKTFGSAVTTVDVEMQLQDSVSEFLRAMDRGKKRVSTCKVAFGD